MAGRHGSCGKPEPDFRPDCPLHHYMASSANIPEPKSNGCYSSVLEQHVEETLIRGIRMATPNILAVDATNAGDTLYRIWGAARTFTDFNCPPYLSTPEQCKAYIRQHPTQVELINLVHKKQAYAWYCETCM
jgi:hypothetical protein